MSSCGIVCGTGGWTGPRPGDPDNNGSLHATPAFGGIDVSWTYPIVNPHAVAHVLLYRGLTNVREAAIQTAVVSGNRYYDRLEKATLYFYWIKIVSINGTVGDWIGPASAMAKPLIEKVIEDLTGKIDAGVLAQSLKKEIDKITLNYSELLTEIGNRVAGNAALSAALADLQNGVTQALAFVDTEITTRIEGDSALAQQVTLLAAANANNAAAIIDERTARVDKDSALTTQYNALFAATGNTAAALTTETQARTNADSALASQITTAQTTLNGSISSVQTTMQTQINAVTGELDAIYTAKVDVSGMVGGFGIYGTPTLVEAGFDVDRFWVGRTSANKRKPFIIENGTVYIDEAAINKLTFSKLRDESGSFIVEGGKVKAQFLSVNNASISGNIYSDNWFPSGGTQGWMLDRSGNLFANNGTFGGKIKANSISIENMAPGGSLPDFVRTHKGGTTFALTESWQILPLDPTALLNSSTVGAGYIGHATLFPPGSYFFELSVPVKSEGSDTIDAVYTALAAVNTDGSIDTVSIVPAGVNVVGDWQTATIFGVGRFTLGVTTAVAAVARVTDISPAARIVSRGGYCTTILRVWRSA